MPLDCCLDYINGSQKTCLLRVGPFPEKVDFELFKVEKTSQIAK